MIFNRYSSPFLFLDNLIAMNKLDDGIDQIYKQVNEERLWEMYIHSYSELTFEEYKNKVLGNNKNKNEIHEEVDLEAAKKDIKNILSNFKPY